MDPFYSELLEWLLLSRLWERPVPNILVQGRRRGLQALEVCGWSSSSRMMKAGMFQSSDTRVSCYPRSGGLFLPLDPQTRSVVASRGTVTEAAPSHSAAQDCPHGPSGLSFSQIAGGIQVQRCRENAVGNSDSQLRWQPLYILLTQHVLICLFIRDVFFQTQTSFFELDVISCYTNTLSFSQGRYSSQRCFSDPCDAAVRSSLLDDPRSTKRRRRRRRTMNRTQVHRLNSIYLQL